MCLVNVPDCVTNSANESPCVASMMVPQTLRDDDRVVNDTRVFREHDEVSLGVLNARVGVPASRWKMDEQPTAFGIECNGKPTLLHRDAVVERIVRALARYKIDRGDANLLEQKSGLRERSRRPVHRHVLLASPSPSCIPGEPDPTHAGPC